MSQPAPNLVQSIRGSIVFAFALAFAIYVAWLLRSVLLLIYVSALFAVIFSPVVRATSRLRIGGRRPFQGKLAILFLLLLVAGGLTAFGFLTVPPVVRDFQSLDVDMPTRLPALVARFKRIPFADRLNSEQVVSSIQAAVGHTAATILLSLKDWAGAVVDVVAGFVLTLYFILEGDGAYRWFLSFLPFQPRKRLDETLGRAAVRMEKWLAGQASLMVILGAVSTILYVSLGIRYPYSLGVLTGLLNVVPVLGLTVSLVIAVLVAAIDSWGRVVGVLVFFAIWVQIENTWLVPRIMKSRVNLPALGIFVALLLGSALAGIPGAVVAIPTAVLVAELLDEYLVRKDAV